MLNKYMLIKKELNINGDLEFMRELRGDDAYTDDIGNAYQFDSEKEARKYQNETENVGLLVFDEYDEGIVTFEII